MLQRVPREAVLVTAGGEANVPADELTPGVRVRVRLMDLATKEILCGVSQLGAAVEFNTDIPTGR